MKTTKIIDDEYQVLPIAKCLPDPLTEFRYNYTGPDVAALADSIQKKGQLEPGYARLDTKTGTYRIYLGQRRLAAIKMAVKKGAKVKGYKAFVSDVSDEEALVRAITENAERNDLDITEQIRQAHVIYGQYTKDKRKAVAEASGLKADVIDTEARLFDRLTEDVVKSIYDIEQKTDFKLSLSHVEKIASVKGTDTVLAVTQFVCEQQVPASKVNQGLTEYIEGEVQKTYSGTAQASPGASAAESSRTRQSMVEGAEEALTREPHLEEIPRLNGDFLTSDGLMFECPKGHTNFLELRLNNLMKFKDPLENPKDSVFAAQDATPNLVIEATKACWKCQTPVVVRIASTEAEGLTMETAKSGSIKAFAKAPVKVSVYCDFGKKKYTVTKSDAADKNREYVLDKTGALKAEGR